ncbi:hypothetical protein KTJ50_14655, partial [Acinetobacter lwoffii]|nr:hypothetical protein [Acinetobacter lwoffii]
NRAMGGESIKPIRKRIHVYFLMTTYLINIPISLIIKLSTLFSIKNYFDQLYFFFKGITV